jgi:hypothetical protein
MARNIAAAAKRDVSKLPRLALPPVELLGGADKKAADTLAQILAAHLAQGGKYAVYPRTESLARIQEEYANQLNGDTADEYLPELGKGTNPERVLSVSARKLGARNMFNAAVINLVTGVQEAGNSASYGTLDEGITAMEDLATVLGGGTAPVRTSREWVAADEASFKRALVAINAAGGGEYTITLTGSFPSDPVRLSGAAAKTITLRGEGRERVISSKADEPLFTVPETLTLILDNNLILNGNKKKARLVRINGGVLVMNAGSSLRGSAEGGVQVNVGGFTMNGGTISGNSTDGSGGGVWVDNGGSFTMSGGTISGNSAIDGGGVQVIGSFTMSGGTITGNLAESDGGGVLVIHGSFTMNGGTISGNSARLGGGVDIGDGSRFTMSGGIISGNEVVSTSVFNGLGGGVYVWGSCRFVKTGGTIDATNTAKTGRVVCVSDGDKKYRIRNSAAGPGFNLDTNIFGRAGGWE